jgi:hypothetical protein
VVEKLSTAVLGDLFSATLVLSKPVPACTRLTSLVDTVNGNGYGGGIVAATGIRHRVCETIAG